jgi:hypothetical protein
MTEQTMTAEEIECEIRQLIDLLNIYERNETPSIVTLPLQFRLRQLMYGTPSRLPRIDTTQQDQNITISFT